MSGPLNLQLANPVEAGINSYAKLKGVQMAEDELAMKKAQQAQDNAWREKEMGWKGEEAARSAATFQNQQTDRENQMLAAALRPIQAKLGQNWASNAGLLDGVSTEEQDLIRKTPQGRALLQFIQGQRGAIDGAIEKFKAGDTRGVAQAFNALYPGQINRGDSVVHPGTDILDVIKQWRDPNAPELGMVKVNAQGKILPPTDPGYADPSAKWVKIGKEAIDVEMSGDGSAYTANILTTTVDPATGTIVRYEAPMTEGRTTGAPVTWKPVANLINDVVQRKGLLDFADQYGLSVNDPVTNRLYEERAKMKQSEEFRAGTTKGKAEDVKAQSEIDGAKARQFAEAITRNNPNATSKDIDKIAGAMKNDPSWQEFFTNPNMRSAVEAQLDARGDRELKREEVKADIGLKKSQTEQAYSVAEANRTYKKTLAEASSLREKFKDSPLGVELATAVTELKEAKDEFDKASNRSLTASDINHVGLDRNAKDMYSSDAAAAKQRYDNALQNIEAIKSKVSSKPGKAVSPALGGNGASEIPDDALDRRVSGTKAQPGNGPLESPQFEKVNAQIEKKSARSDAASTKKPLKGMTDPTLAGYSDRRAKRDAQEKEQESARAVADARARLARAVQQNQPQQYRDESGTVRAYRPQDMVVYTDGSLRPREGAKGLTWDDMQRQKTGRK